MVHLILLCALKDKKTWKHASIKWARLITNVILVERITIILVNSIGLWLLVFKDRLMSPKKYKTFRIIITILRHIRDIGWMEWAV